MSRPPPARAGAAGTDTGAAGFTLLEMLVVLIIAGLVLALAIPAFPRLFAGLQLKAAAHDLMRDLAAARSAAITQARAVRLIVVPDQPGYTLDGRVRALSCDCRVALAAAAPGGTALSLLPEASGAPSGIAFYPDGGASGGALTVTQDGRGLMVAVDWMTGRAALVAEPAGTP
jgi:general secretion pathway protein H